MKQVLIEIEDELAAKLEKVAPARSRKRSDFIRAAIKQALSGMEEDATRRAYQRMPDDLSDYAFDARTWEPWDASSSADRVCEPVATKKTVARKPKRARRSKRPAR